MAEIPQWFTTEVLRRLSGVKRGKEPGQFYARCPAHDDKHASLAIRPGDEMPLVYHCHTVPGCDHGAIREALAALGVPEEYLGQYGTPAYEARRRTRAASDEWRQIERLRYEMLDLKSTIRGLLSADLSLAMLKVRMLAVVDETEIPADRKEYVAFAMKAGVSQPRAYATWKVDPLGRARVECHTLDHVVLTQPEEERQAPQVTGRDRIIGTRRLLSEREPENSRTDNSRNPDADAEFDAAERVLREGGLTGGNEAA